MTTFLPRLLRWRSPVSVACLTIVLAAGLHGAPVITTRSLSQVAQMGAPVTFSVGVTGAGPYTYEWRHNRQVIPGADGPTLQLAAAAQSDRGYYEVTVSDEGGAKATSVSCLAVVVPSPVVTSWGPFAATVPALSGGVAAISQDMAGVALKADGSVVVWSADWLPPVPAGLTGVVAIATEGSHVLALKGDGTVVCWGTDYAASVPVPAGLTEVVAIAAGMDHNLALKADGTVVAWGNGNATMVTPGLSNVVAIAAGDLVSVALKSDGTLAVWGVNTQGALNVPAGLGDVVAVSTGRWHTLALKADGSLALFGAESYAQTRAIPAGLSNVVAVAAGGFQSLALKADGTLVGWGGNGLDGSTIPTGLSAIVSMATGDGESLALTANTPPTVVLQPGAQSVVAGDYVTLEAGINGSLPLTYQWRRNGADLSNGAGLSGVNSPRLVFDEIQPGDAGSYELFVTNAAGSVTTAPALLEVRVPPAFSARPFSRIVQAGQSVTFDAPVVDPVGVTYQWRHNGQVVAGATGASLTLSNVGFADRGFIEVAASNAVATNRSYCRLEVSPVPTSGLTVVGWSYAGALRADIPAGLYDNVVALAADVPACYALTDAGALIAWPATGLLDVPSSLNQVVAVATRGVHTIAARADGRVFVWGHDGAGAGSNIVLPGLRNAVAVASGAYSSYVLRADGSVIGWGGGQAALASALTGVVQLAAGDYHLLALKGDGAVVGVGDDSASVPPAGLTGVRQLAAGYRSSLALKTDGTLVAWSSPGGGSAIPAGLTGVVAISVYSTRAFALKSDGSVVAWNLVDGQPVGVPALSGAALVSAGEGGLALIPAVAPVVTTEPADVTTINGRSVSLAVAATGTAPIFYQWQKDGAPLTDGGTITGAQTAKLTLTNLQPTDTGGYRVTVTNAAGSIDSREASLIVTAPPVFTQVPRSRRVASGQPVTFSASATDPGTVTYQWRHNGQDIPGAIGQDFTIPAVSPADRGTYEVVVSNGQGSRRAVFVLHVAPQTAANTEVVAWGDRYGARAVTIGINDAVDLPGANLALRSDGTVVNWNSLFPPYVTNTVMADVVSVSSGGDGHALVLRSDGTVKSLFYAFDDALTDTIYDVVAVAAGYYVNYALRTDGTVITWSNQNPTVISQIPGLTGIVSIAAGDSHVLALRADGTVLAAGSNGAGETTVPPGLSGVVAVAGGNQWSGALKSDGTVVAWGNPAGGRTAVPSGLTGVIAIAAEFAHGLALKSDGTLVSWGSTFNMYFPVTPPELAGSVLGMGASPYADAAIIEPRPVGFSAQPADTAVIAGRPAGFGVGATFAATYQWQVLQAGGGGWTNTVDGAGYGGSSTPSLAVLVTTVADHGDQYRCVVTNYGGSATSASATLTVVPVGFAKISAGRYHSLRLNTDAQLFSMGMNDKGQLGLGAVSASSTPQPVTLASQTVAGIAAGAQHSLILTTTKELWGTGINASYQLGDGTSADRTTPVRLATNVVGMAAAIFHSAYLKADGTLWTFGGNDSGQLGDGTLVNRPEPVPVATGVVDLALGNRQSFFLKSDGTLWGMGDMNGSGVPVSTPVQIATQVRAVAAGGYHSLFIKTDGTLWSLGYNPYGQLGNGTTVDSTTPVLIDSGVKAVAAGYFHSAYLKNDGTLWLTGYNSGGQLGDGSTTARSTPFQMATDVAAVSASEGYTLFARTDGSLWATGYNANAQFGNGSFTSVSTPVQVAAGAIEPPWLPQGLAASTPATLDRIHLTWRTTADAASYEVWRNTVNNSATATRIASGVRWGVYEDLSLGVYHYWIKAVNPAGTSVFSAPVTGTSGNVPPSFVLSPTGRTAAVGTAASFVVTASGTNPLTYQWRRNGVNLVDGGRFDGVSASVLTIASLQLADAGSYDVVVSNAYGSATSVAAALTVVSGYFTWWQAKFTADELLDANISGPNAVYGQDGLPNLVKYALGLEPKQNITTGLPAVSTTATDWVYTYTRPNDRTDLTYEVEVSTNLTTWSTTGVTHTLQSSSGGMETWAATYPLVSAPNVYFRLKVTSP